jgi:hypothetical protein
LTLASPRYEFQAFILLKKFLEKIINLRLIKEMASFKKSHVTAPYFLLAGLSPKLASGFENPPVLMGTHRLWTKNRHWDGGGGENGLGRHLELPSPHSREFFFHLILLGCWASGLFYWCKMSLLMQSYFLIFTQPSWYGYLLLFSPKKQHLRHTLDIK